MEITLLSKLLPGTLSLVSDDICFFQFYLHNFYFRSEFGILVVHVSYQTDLDVMERSFLLELVPLLLEDVEGLGHFEFLHEISNEVVDHNISRKSLRNCVGYPGFSG